MFTSIQAFTTDDVGPGWYIDDISLQSDSPSNAGTYFGTFAGNAGTWSLIVRDDGSGTYIAYLNNPKSAIVTNVQVAADGTFRTLTTTVQPQSAANGPPVAAAATVFTLSGTIGSGGVTGNLEGLNVSFAGAIDPPGGASAAVSGLYQAGGTGGAGTTYAVVGSTRQVVALTVGATLVDGGLGTVSASGAFTVTTVNNTQINGTVVSTTGAITATVAPTNGPAVTVTGFSVEAQVAPTRLVNLSILSDIATSGDNFTLGYVVGGAGTTGSKPVVIRAAGPSLAALSVASPLTDPKLELYAGTTKTGENDNWGGTADLTTAMANVGAFPLSGPTSRDAAAMATITTRDNSVRISAVGTLTGAVMAEVYDATPNNSFTGLTPRLINLSVLKQIGSGFTVGFVVGGRTTRTVLIRAVGPTLGAAPFHVGGVMADPRLTLFAAATKIDENDNWSATPALIAPLTAAMTQVGAFVLPGASRDAALLTTLQPGNYSVQVALSTGAPGLVLVEVYEVP
ncbi:MAG: hypothetical protein Q8N18_03665 [Opitutaceae bacterium]|nr:hypothetical protein [Opitutaceae bacterium]